MPMKNLKKYLPFYVALVLLLLTLVLLLAMPEADVPEPTETTQQTQPIETTQEMTQPVPQTPEELVSCFAQEHGLTLEDYPEVLLETLKKNPETEEFVLNYPLEVGNSYEVDLSEYDGAEEVPLFMQWDRRWGYMQYGSDVAGLTACGPVCLAMVGYYLTGDEKFAPDRMITYAIEEGYCVTGSGTYWSLMDQGAEALGLDSTGIPVDEDRVLRNLEAGNPIICIMGPGDFTEYGHFIVLTSVEDGMLRVNDPNSRSRSGQLWSFEEISSQIRALWVIRYFP